MLVPILELASSETQPPAHIAALALGHISGCAVQFSQPENSWGFARFAKNKRKYFFSSFEIISCIVIPIEIKVISSSFK